MYQALEDQGHSGEPCTQRIALISQTGVRIHYIDCQPPRSKACKGTLLLIHGFPQTSYQFRHVADPLACAGYRVIAPDYRGAGRSSHPENGFTKSVMAADLFHLVYDYLEIRNKVHLVGHDIGGMIAHAYASRYPAHVASVVWGECPLPGTAIYEKHKAMPEQFHFIFHRVADLPEALVAGREGVYLRHFFDKLAFNAAAISQTDFDRYVADYSQPGAMRCAFGVYRAFEADAQENRNWLKDQGKCKVPALGFSGDHSRHAGEAAEMVSEMYENADMMVVHDSGHYLAEENPVDFVRKVLTFVERHS